MLQKLYSILITLFVCCLNTIAQQPAYAFSSVRDKIQAWADSGYYAAASVIIAKDDKVIYKAYSGNYQVQTVVFIASAGKWLAVATIAAVVDEGKLNWNDKVKKWLTEFKDARGAMLKQLLSHTAGYPDYQPISSPSWAGAYPWTDKKNHVYRFILTHITHSEKEFNSFLASPVLAMMTRTIIEQSVFKKQVK